MGSNHEASTASSDPAAGFYPVPDHHKKVVVREWDGLVWKDEVRPAADGTELPSYKRHFFRFLRSPGWKLVLLFIIATGIASALWRIDAEAKWVSGIQFLMPVFALIATFSVLFSFVLLLSRRLGFDRVVPTKQIIAWGVLSGIVGVGIAFFGELGVPKILGSDPKHEGWNWITGPSEETGKLLVPVILWFTGRFRTPREGFMLVIISGVTFGLFEGTEYAISPEIWQPFRGFAEIMHPILTGFIAAVAWQAAWGRNSWFTPAAIGAWFIAAFGHSFNDVLVLDGSTLKIASVITPVMILTMYLLQKHSARQLVPPDKVGEVSPRWRPVAPRSS